MHTGLPCTVRTGEARRAIRSAGVTLLLMNRCLRLFLVLSASIGTSGCALLSGRCLYETRGVDVSGSVVTSATDSASAMLVNGEQRDYEPDRNLSWQILGEDLKNHVQAIVLLETATASASRFNFPLNPSTIPPLSSGFVRESDGTDLRGMFDVLSSGKAVIRITTDLPEKASVVIPLTHVQRFDWSRPYCS